jgi:alpha-ketoglutarate-dependent taurine dioxygenase
MEEPRKPRTLGRPGGVERRAVSVDAGELVTFDGPPSGRSLPLTIRPALGGLSLAGWAASNRATVESLLARHGALLFRGFDGADLQGLAELVRAVSGDLLEYRERSSPRTQVADNIYTSTEHPAHQAIFLHNENSYAHTFPLKLFFLCSVAPAEGGETPVADCRRILEALDPRIRERFAEKRVLYVRNFSDALGLPWQTVFGTSDRADVSARCREAGYDVEWLDGGLRTRRVGPAVARHPRTREATWFNHATFFHVSTLEADVRDALLAQYGEDRLPNNTYYGDGSPIEPSVLDELRRAYLDAKVRQPWQDGDVMLVDNVLAAHAREPFSGARKIHVAMSEPCTAADISA